MAFGKEIKRLRLKSGFSVRELAETIGVSAIRLKHWETKDLTPRADDRRIIEDFFGLKIEEFESMEKFPESMVHAAFSNIPAYKRRGYNLTFEPDSFRVTDDSPIERFVLEENSDEGRHEGELLRQLIRREGYTQEDAADRLGMSRQTLSLYFQKEILPQVVLQNVSERLNINVTAFKKLSTGEEQLLNIIRIIYGAAVANESASVLKESRKSVTEPFYTLLPILDRYTNSNLSGNRMDLAVNFVSVLLSAFLGLSNMSMLFYYKLQVKEHQDSPTKYSDVEIRHLADKINKIQIVIDDNFSSLKIKLGSPADFNMEKIDLAYLAEKFSIVHKDTIDLLINENVKSIPPWIIVHDQNGIATVPASIQYDYVKYLNNEEYISNLPLTTIVESSYHHLWFRMFEVTGENMIPEIQRGDFVIGEFVDKKFYGEIANYYAYIIVTEDRIIISRVVALGNDDLLCVNDNSDFFPATRVEFNQIQELWRVSKKISIDNVPAKKIEVDKKWGVS